MSVIYYLANGRTSSTYYARDKKTGEIFRQKIILPDYKGKDFSVDPSLLNYYEKEYHFELDLIELKEAYRENRLSGKLKELVATLKELEDNNVFVFVNFFKNRFTVLTLENLTSIIKNIVKALKINKL